jgi:hypothetical protein
VLQRVSVAVQHGNAACVIGTVRQDCSWDDIFYLLANSDTESIGKVN